MTKVTNLLLAVDGDGRAFAQVTSGGLLKTYSMSDKPPSTWDAARVAAARAMGYRDPQKHGKYADHRPLVEPYVSRSGIICSAGEWTSSCSRQSWNIKGTL